MTAAAPVWMLRVNPMARRRLADAELADRLEQLVDLEGATRSLAESASDDLYRMVPQAGSETVRRHLLALRRTIHNDRLPSAAVAVNLPVELPGSVKRWSDHHDLRLACRSEIRRIHSDALTRERSMLRQRLGEGHFLTTLAQSAAGVYADACRYAAGDRKAERALLQYLTRAMVRTSPYGRFTAVGLATPRSGGVAMDDAMPDTATAQVEVDRALFEYVMGGLMAVGADAAVSLPPTARVADDRITFFQFGPDALRRLAAPMTGHTALLVELLALGPRRLSSLAAAVADRLPTGLPAAERLVQRACHLGLLVTAWRGDEFVAAPLEQAAQDLSSGGTGEMAEMAEHLRRFQADLGRLGERDPDAGRATAIRHRLAARGDTLSQLAGRPAKLAVHEDFVLDPLLVDPGAHQPALDDLAAVTQFLSAFDRTHVVRALAAAAVVERFGPGCRVALVEHAETVVRMVYQAEQALVAQPDAAIGPADGSLAMLAKVRREALDALGRDLALGTGDEGGEDEVRWSPGDVADLVAGLPDRFRADPASYGMVVQPSGCDLIVNDAYAGHGPMVSRFLHADQVRGGDASARLRSRLRALYGPGVGLLEDEGRHGMSLNAHPPVLDERVGPEGWRGLHLRHDVDTDTVCLEDGGGSPVKILALGAQLPELFPYPVRLATWLCSSGRIVVDIPGQGHRRNKDSDSSEATMAYRRLRVGRVILSRRRWYPGTDFPARNAPSSGCATDVEYLLALTRWRAGNRVPAEVVLKSVVDGPTRWAEMGADGPREQFFDLRRQSKPQYVDLASALMARVLPRFLERRPDGFIEEARPALAEGGHALEWMVEMARPAGATHFDWRGGARDLGRVHDPNREHPPSLVST